ncbi:MAG: fibronectin type III domain-containing protein [Eubacterium sp.]|nr:fibronectin type III domain-containing protein [Eubacterium sp.]
MKRVISTILSVIMIATALYIPSIGVFANDKVQTVDCIDNPFYANREIATGELAEYTVPESTERTYKNVTYYTKGKKLYKAFGSALEKRATSVTLRYLATAPIIGTLTIERVMDELFCAATDDSISVSCTDGDYTRWSTLNYRAEFINDQTSGYYFYTIKITKIKYYSDADDEKIVNTVVNNFVNTTNTSGMSDYQIIKKVHDYVCSSTTYCNKAIDDPYGNLYAYGAYGALVLGSCVCQGYSLAFYRLCKELGYSVRIITSAPHAWNLVGLNGQYYYVDTTWDDDNDVKSYDFFLVSYSDLRKEDSLNEHIPEEKYYDGEYYNETYGDNIDLYSYDETDDTLLSNCTVSLSNRRYTYSGSAFKPAVTVKSINGDNLAADDYTVKYASNTKAGCARVNLTAGTSGNYSGSTHRQFDIAPQKTAGLSLASGGRGSTSLKLKWTAAQGGISGYKIEYYKDGAWKVVATVANNSTTAVINSLAAAKTHKFRIRAYKAVSKRNVYGAYSGTYTTCTNPQKPAVTLKTRSKTIVANWKKVTADGFQIQVCTKKDFSSKVKKYKVGGKSTQKTVKSLKPKTVYYVRVRAYKVINDKTYYSPWSAVKKLKCK